MAVTLFNVLTGKKEPLVTLEPRRVKMYCCGVTPYSNTHIGHCRTFVSYDLLFRTLKDSGLEVDWARNITDVDDKIIKKANEENVSCDVIVNRYVAEQDKMLDDFKLLRPMHEPKVTDSIPEIINIISTLIEKEYAYVTSSGVYYRLRKFSKYGELSGNNVDELRKGVRIEVDESKEDPLDFALWKFAKPGEIKWSSPWGDGRPGWHIECSAMIHSLYGDSIDIHMGGRDLIFPHHEAEIAQSEAATGKQFSRFWLYGGMLKSDGEKMSKSLGNYVSIKDFLERYPPEVLRLFFLGASYAQPLDFTWDLAEQNLKKLGKLYRFVALVESHASGTSTPANAKPFEQSVFAGIEKLVPNMRSALQDDLNTSAALAHFFEFVKSVNAGLTAMEKKGATFHDADKKLLQEHWGATKNWVSITLGVLQESPEEFFKTLSKYKLTQEISPSEIQSKIDARNAARANKDWSKADVIRDELLSQGIQIQDTPNGTKWTVSL